MHRTNGTCCFPARATVSKGCEGLDAVARFRKPASGMWAPCPNRLLKNSILILGGAAFTAAITDLFSVPASAAEGDCGAEAEFCSNLRSPYTLRLAPGEPVSRFGRRKSTVATQRKTPSGKGVLGRIDPDSSYRRRRCGPSRAGSDRAATDRSQPSGNS
jgi:hypothetical protein